MSGFKNGKRSGLLCRYAFFYAVLSVCLVVGGTACAAEFDTATKPSTMVWRDADAACKSRGGTLPSVAALQAISAGTGSGSYAANGWSTGMYWTGDAAESGHPVVFLGDGKSLPFPDNSKQWVVCVDVAQKPAPEPEKPGVFDLARKPTVLPWDEAAAFCGKQGKRLPSIADLQRIAKGTGDGSFEEIGFLEQIFWTREPGGEGHRGVIMGDGRANWYHDTTKNWSVCVE